MSSARIDRFRRLIADRVTESWKTIPHFSVTREIDATPLLRSYRELRQVAPQGTLTDLMVYALARSVPSADGDDFDIGLAVASDFGVMMPSLKNVSALSLGEVIAARTEAVERGRTGRLSTEDIASVPRASLSNLGALGVDQFSGIVPVGQTSILTVGRVRERAAVEGDQIVVRPSFSATLNVDHRAFDGAEAARMLVAFDSACAASFSLEK